MQATRVHIAVLDEDLDARAVRHGGQITAYLSYHTPVWAREAAVAHLTRAVQAAEGHTATVHLDKGESVLVALDSVRPQRRARPRLPVSPLDTALALIALPFVGALFVFNQPWVAVASIEPTLAMSDHLNAPVQLCMAPAAPPPQARPAPVTAPQPVTSEHPPPSEGELARDITPTLPLPTHRYPGSTVPGHPPAELPAPDEARHYTPAPSPYPPGPAPIPSPPATPTNPAEGQTPQQHDPPSIPWINPLGRS